MFKKYLKEFFVFLFSIIIITNAINIYRTNDSTNKLKIENLSSLSNPQLSIKNNKPLLIYFWAVWCPVCKMESQNINTLSKYYSVVTVAVKSGDDDEIKKYLQEHELHFDTINDENGSIANAFNVNVFPTTAIYKNDGTLFHSDMGYTSTIGLFFRMWLAGFY